MAYIEICKYVEPVPIKLDSPYFEPKGYLSYRIPSPAEPLAAKERRAHKRHVRRLHLERQAEMRGIIQRMLEWPWCGSWNEPVALKFGVDKAQGVIVAGWHCEKCAEYARLYPQCRPIEAKPEPPPPPPPPEEKVPSSTMRCRCGRRTGDARISECPECGHVRKLANEAAEKANGPESTLFGGGGIRGGKTIQQDRELLERMGLGELDRKVLDQQSHKLAQILEMRARGENRGQLVTTATDSRAPTWYTVSY